MMSGRGVKRNRRGGNFRGDNDKSKTPRSDVDETSPVIQMFRQCQKSLDKRHDKHERIVKLSRDITIESKRTIFQLHRISGCPDPDNFLKEAEDKLKNIQDTKWKAVARELKGEDSYQFLKAYSPGLQEYIEALSFWMYLKEKRLVSIDDVEKGLKFEVDENEPSESKWSDNGENTSKENKDVTTTESDVTNDHEMTPDRKSLCSISVHVPPMEYILGIADLTGELMRMAINSLGCGDLAVPFELCTFMRVIHDAFVLFGNVQRELPRKLNTLKQSLKKVENACYTLQVRGSEIPKHMLKDVFTSLSGEVPGQFDDCISD